MKARELRIGNYITNREGESYAIKSAYIIKALEDWELLRYSKEPIIKPIPLTEEWLLKFGWGKGEFDTEYVDNTSLSQEVLSYTVNSNMLCIETNSDIIEVNHIKYVHQLQNLYFSLTGEELVCQQK